MTHPASGPARRLAGNRDLLRRVHEELGIRVRPQPRIEREADGPALATAGQEQIWFFDQLAHDAAFHTVPLLIDIAGPLDAAALQRALEAVVARHEPLRTAWAARDGVLAPQVTPHVRVLLLRHDLGGLPLERRRAALAALTEREQRRPVDLSSAPLLRATLVRSSEDDHRLLVAMHHIATDGHSLAVFQKELLACYGELARGRTPDLPELPVSYSDFARWERAAASGETMAAHLRYWRRVLSDLPEPVELPFSPGERTGVSHAAGVAPLVVPERLVTAVRRLARESRMSPFMVLLTAFGVLLHRYTGATDLVIGTPSAGREQLETQDLIGYFVNLLALRLRLQVDPTWREALRAVRETTLAAFDHRAAPFGEVVRALQPSREVGRHPVFQIVFGSPPPLAPPSTVAGATFAFAEGDSDQALYDLEVELPDGGRGDLHGRVKYRTALLERHGAEALARHYTLLLQQLVSAPDERLSRLSLLDQSERTRVVSDWNATRSDYPAYCSVPSLFEERADAAPDATALEHDGNRLTYGELDRRANQLARYLCRLGITAESRVALCLEHGLEWVVGALAVLKAGGVYVPLDPTYPVGRLALMCADSGAQVVVVSEATRDRVGASGVRTVVLEREREAIAAEPDSRPHCRARPDSLAYVMYTSGSTGRPKGVAVSHRNIVRLVRDTNYVVFEPADTVAQGSNVSFDAATFEVWGALLNGARLVALAKQVALDPGRLGGWLRAHRVDTLFLTTSLAMHVAREAPQSLCGLRYFVFGGEQPASEAVARLAAFPGGPQHLVNGYGPTETTTFAAAYRCNAVSAAETRIPVGFPISNSRLYVLDRYLEPVPPGVVGELFIGGDGVARGYLNRPDLTAERFVPDHLGGGSGVRLYRTGDLARYRPDGAVELLGRMDRQVKIRGFRVEPEEIENCLRRCSGVRQAAVLAQTDGAGDPRLVGYVVLADPGAGTEPLYRHLRAALPAYMVPDALVALPRLPLTENGKLDTRALPSPAPTAVLGGQNPTSRTPMEERLAAVWKEVLGVDQVDRDTDFFELGGHSLKATRAVARLNQQLGVDVPLRLLFEHPTIASLAQALERLSEGEPVPMRAPRRTARTQRSITDLLDSLPTAGPEPGPTVKRGESDSSVPKR